MKNSSFLKKEKWLFTAIIVEIFCLMIVVAISIYSLHVEHLADVNFIKATQLRYESYLLADQLRQSSDDLTRMVRSYVASGDARFEKYFFDILAIRDGEKPRPLHYNRVYWDFMTVENPVPPYKNGKKESLEQLMREAGFSDKEFQLLAIAKKYSDELVLLENIAMQSMKGRFQDSDGNFTIQGEPAPQKAVDTVFGKEYHEKKKKIMQPINEFFDAIDLRTAKNVSEAILDVSFYHQSMAYIFGLLIFNGLLLLITAKKHQNIQLSERKEAETELHKHRDYLEKVVEERTVELTASNRALSESENKYRGLFDAAFEGVMVTDNGKILDANRTAAMMFGYSLEELTNMDSVSLVAPEDRENVLVKISSGDKKSFELNAITKYGAQFPVEIRTKMFVFKGRKLRISAIRDLTEQKEAKKEKKELIDQLKDAQRIAQLGHWKLNHMDDTLYWSDETFRILGYSPQAFEPTFDILIDIVHPEDRTYVKKTFRDSLRRRDKYDIEHRMLTEDGREKWVRAICTTEYDQNNTPIESIGTLHDMTKRHQIEIELKEAKENAEAANLNMKQIMNVLKENETKLETITSTASDAIIMMNEEGNIIFFNQAAEKMFLYSVDEAIGSNLHAMLVPEKYQPTFHKAFPEFVKTGKGDLVGETIELIGKKKDQTEFPVEISLAAVKMQNHWNAVGVIRDVTARKKMETSLRNAKISAEKASQAKSEFLANMSHEIRTPMNAIIGFTEILKTRISDKQLKEYVNIIESSCNILLGLINDILDLSKVEAGKLSLEYQTLNIFSFIENIKKIFHYRIKEKGLTFHVSLDADLPTYILIDENRLHQILINLIGNAIKFTSQGSIKLSVHGTRRIHKKIDCTFIVEDTGIGINENDLDNIFNMFEQANAQSQYAYGGSGLGLTISKRLTELMNGEIEVNSTPEQGTQFKITLKNIDVVDKKADDLQLENQRDLALLVFEKAKIMVVDDITTNRELLLSFLEPFNFELIQAENGKDAIEKARLYKPDLIFMDIRMPVMDGYEATRILKNDEKLKHTPVIAVTASLMKQESEKYKEVCDNIISKPATYHDVMHALVTYINHWNNEDTSFHPENKPSSAETSETKEKEVQGHDFSQLVTILSEEIKPQWEDIIDTMTINDIEDFAYDMTVLGKKFNCSKLISWAESLSFEVSVFNMPAVTKIINQFETVLNELNDKKDESCHMTIKKIQEF